MDQDYHIAADLHTHTIASGHAADTIRTIAQRACLQRLEGVAITDHGNGLPGGSAWMYFMAVPRMMRGIDLPIRVISGAEDDIQNKEGDLTLPDHVRANMELIITGLHPFTWMSEQILSVRTEGVVNAISRNLIHFFAHPVSTFYSIELDPVLRAAAQSGVAMELNCSKLSERGELVHFLERCAELEVGVVVNSDAHVAEEVGVFTGALSLLREVGFPPGLILNRSRESIESFLGIEW
jgi:putative hydrolase